MIDIHCHLLPGVDDGPPDLQSALRLAQQAVDDGITHAVITPHIHVGRWDNFADNLEKAIEVFRECLVENGIPLFVGLGSELRIGPEIQMLLEWHSVPFLGRWQGEKVLLLELPHGSIPAGTEVIISWLLSQDIRPIIAHPERNKEIMRRFDKVDMFLEMGCLLQVTAGSLVGQFGERAQSVAMKLLTRNLITVLASDAHHISRRPANLSQGRLVASEVLGESAAHKLVYENPLSIVRKQFSDYGAI